MIYEGNMLFWLGKAVLITSGTLGMMSALTVFRYDIKKVLSAFGIYMAWVTLSTFVLLQSGQTHLNSESHEQELVIKGCLESLGFHAEFSRDALDQIQAYCP